MRVTVTASYVHRGRRFNADWRSSVEIPTAPLVNDDSPLLSDVLQRMMVNQCVSVRQLDALHEWLMQHYSEDMQHCNCSRCRPVRSFASRRTADRQTN